MIADLPLWIVFTIQALCPDSKAPFLEILSIPCDSRDLLVIPLAIYYIFSWLNKALSIKNTAEIKPRELAILIKNSWHNQIPIFSILILLYAIISMDWSRLDTINFFAMLYTILLTGVPILISYMILLNYILMYKHQAQKYIYELLWSITIFIASISVVYTILTFFSLLHFGGLKMSVDTESIGRVKGPFFGVASAYFLLVPTIGFALQRIIDNQKNRLFNLGIGFALILTLIGTGSRGAILSFLIFILLIFCSTKNKKKAATWVIGLALIVMIALGIYYGRSEKVATRVQSSESVERVSTYKTSMQIIIHRSTKSNIFGSGYASYWPWYLPQVMGRTRDVGLVWVPYGEILYKSHSLLLSLVIELGVFGLFYYIWLWLTLIKLYCRNFSHAKTPLLNCALLASLVCSFFETPIIAMPSLATSWWIFTFGALFLNRKRVEA